MIARMVGVKWVRISNCLHSLMWQEKAKRISLMWREKAKRNSVMWQKKAKINRVDLLGVFLSF